MASSSEFPDLKYIERELKMWMMTHPPTHNFLSQQASGGNGNLKL